MYGDSVPLMVVRKARQIRVISGVSKPLQERNRDMSITRKKLGNNSEVILEKYHECYIGDGAGLAWEAFCNGWREAWQECSTQLAALDWVSVASGELPEIIVNGRSDNLIVAGINEHGDEDFTEAIYDRNGFWATCGEKLHFQKITHYRYVVLPKPSKGDE